MPSLRSNLVRRVERLPKPTNVSSALQPLFEAVSNAIHSTQGKFGASVARKGRVNVEVTTDRKKEDVRATVEDNGVGLDEKNWEAFQITDTDNKVDIGGKGVGRLLWLDCFDRIEVSSVFEVKGSFKRREFVFTLALEDQFASYKESAAKEAVSSSFKVTFSGLRSNEYSDKFPGRGSFVFQHLTSHFLPTFIGKRCPIITVRVGDDVQSYPKAIEEIVRRSGPAIALETKQYGNLSLVLMECEKSASADLKGSHFVHFIAHDRTVHSQCIDGKLGLKNFGTDSDRVFHGVITGGIS